MDKEELENEETLADEQKKRSYYYDDAHGYEIYDPDDDDDDDDTDQLNGETEFE